MEGNITAVDERSDVLQHDTTLRPKQVRFLSCLVACSSIKEACQYADIHRSTFYRWMNMPEFRAAMQSLQNRMLAEGLSNIKKAFTKAAAELASSSFDSLDKQKVAISLGMKVLELELKYGKHKAPQGEGVVNKECLEPDDEDEAKVLASQESSRNWM